MSDAKPRRGRPARTGEAATKVLQFRCTAAEQERFFAVASLVGVDVSTLIRSWLDRAEANDLRDLAAAEDEGAPQPAVPAVAAPMTDAVARPRAGVEPDICSRWTPLHVWTLHRVPGRLDGPPLAVRRRVLRDHDEGAGRLVVETPGGNMELMAGELEATDGAGRTRSGYAKYSDDYGADLGVEIFDHCPTPEEREAWLARRRRFSGLLCNPPTHAYLVGPNNVRRFVVKRVQIRRARVGWADAERFELEHRAGDRAWSRRGGDLRDLSDRGWVGLAWPLRLYLAPPSAEEIAKLQRVYLEQVRLAEEEQERADARQRAREAEQQAREKREAEARERQRQADFTDAVRRACAADPTIAGRAVLTELGLDAKATADDVRAAFRQKAKTTHPDKGGKGDMGRLVQLRDLALAFVQPYRPGSGYPLS